MQEISNGVYQIKIPMKFNPLKHTYSYLLRDAATLIDTGVGTDQAFQALREQLKVARIRLSDIKKIILTHLHRDHAGLVERVLSASDATVCAHRTAVETQNLISEVGRGEYQDYKEELELLGGSVYLTLFGRFENALRRPRPSIDIDRALDDDELIAFDGFTLKVFWTPGHSPEHICLYDANKRILYSGDHVLPKITSHISLHTFQEGDPLNDYLRSLERLRGLLVKAVLPAHEHVFYDLDERILVLELHHARRCNEIKETLRGGKKTVFQVSAYISWDSKPWPQMGFWTKRMAAAETLAHLVYLRNRGEVKEELEKGVLYYSSK